MSRKRRAPTVKSESRDSELAALRQEVERLKSLMQDRDKKISSLEKTVRDLKTIVNGLRKPLSEQLAELNSFELSMGSTKIQIDNRRVLLKTHGGEIDLGRDDLKVRLTKSLKMEAGTSTELKAGSTAKIESSATMTIKGAMVNIN